MQNLAKVISFIFILSLLNNMAIADGNSPPMKGYGDHGGQPPTGGQSAHDAAVEKALAICKTSVEHDQNGQPDRQAVNDCMTNKGFKKPPHRNDNPPPPKGIKDHSPPPRPEDDAPQSKNQ